jgi:hypothetical protein
MRVARPSPAFDARRVEGTLSPQERGEGKHRATDSLSGARSREARVAIRRVLLRRRAVLDLAPLLRGEGKHRAPSDNRSKGRVPNRRPGE